MSSLGTTTHENSVQDYLGSLSLPYGTRIPDTMSGFYRPTEAMNYWMIAGVIVAGLQGAIAQAWVVDGESRAYISSQGEPPSADSEGDRLFLARHLVVAFSLGLIH